MLTGWWISWGVLHFLVLDSYGMALPEAIIDSLICTVLLAAACLLIMNNMKYYLPGDERYWYVLTISAALGLIWTGLSRLFLWMIFRDNESYTSMLAHSSVIRFAIAFLMMACVAVLSLLWYSVQERKKSDKHKSDTEKFAREAELSALRQQLQPHFLFNSLNSINALIGSNPEEARNMIHQLSLFLRGTLRKEERQLVTLKEELEQLALYLAIEKVRFGNRLSPVIHGGETNGRFLIPSLLLQPVVENAIKFGLYDTTGHAEIIISAAAEKNMLRITVQNPFDPETSNPAKGTGFGLSSVRRRLYLLYGRKDLLETQTQDTIFITTLLIPQ